MKFSFYQPLSGGRPLSGGDSAEASVEAIKDEKTESGAAVKDEVDFDENRDDTSDIEDEEEGSVANEREENVEKDTQSNGVEEVAGQEWRYTGVEDEAIVEDEGHERKEDNDASQPDHFVKVKGNRFEVVFDASDCPLERVASNDSVDSNSSIHSTASEISHKLEAIMLDRIAAIDLIRNLLETELENDNDLIAEFTGKVSSLEQDVMSKEDCIKALNKQVNEIKSKNGDYARELSILSCTIDELTGRMVELERDVAAKKDALEEINEDVQEKQVIINTKVEENNTLSVELETLKSENDGLKATVDNLQSRNAAYAEEFENLLASLRELVDQNTKLENQVKELVDANKQLEELESRVRDLTGSLEESKVAYEAMKQVNEDANKQLEVLDSRVQDLTGSLEESKVANEAMKQVTKELRKEKVHFSDTVKKLEKVIDDTTAQMQAQLSSQKTKHDQEISVLERGLEMEIVSSGKVKKQCTETKKKYHNEVVKNEELKLKYEEMKSTHKKTLAGLTAALEERTTLLTKENTILLKQLEEESTATTQIATRQASLESELKSTKKSNKQEIAKLMNDLKAAESKAEALSKELTEEKDTTTKIAEMNAKLESKMKSNKKSDKKEAKEAAEKFQNALNIVQQQLAAEKEITAKLKGLQGRLEETEQHLLTAINSRTDLTEKLQEINGLNTDLKKDLAESKESQLHVLDRMNKLLERLDEKDDALSKITMEKSALFENLTATQGLNTQLTSEIKALTNERSKNDAEVNKFLNRLEENQRLLTVATAEKDQLRSMYDDMESLNKKLTTKLEESRDDASKTVNELHKRLHETMEKEANVKKRIKESDRTLVMVAKEKEDLEKHLMNEKGAIHKMTIALQAIKEEKESLEKLMAKEIDEKIQAEKVVDSLQSSLSKAEESLAEIESEKKALEEEKSALKSSLHEARKALGIVSREMAELEQQKHELENNLYAKLVENKGKHSDAISAIQARMKETDETLTRVKSERDDLQCNVNELQELNHNLSLELDESRSILSRDSASWQEEKLRMIAEKVKLTQNMYEIESALVTMCNQKVVLEAQKTDIERELSRELLETKGKHNKTVAEIQVRLQNTENQLANVKTEKEKLEQSVRDLQEINHSMSYETADKSNDWNEERGALMNRLMETERTLVLVASQNEGLERKMTEEKETLTNRLTETEKALVTIASQKQQLEQKHALLEKKMWASSPLPLPPRPPQNDMSAELGRLQMSFLKEKKVMLGRQEGLERMLMEALSFDKENNTQETKPATATPKSSNENLLVDAAHVALGGMRGRSEPRVRAHSRSRLPLSPTGSVTSRGRRSIDPIDP